jgi:hypothetical protein
MRIVAIHTVVFLLRTTAQIPVTVESSVDAVFIIFHLRAMALAAQSHNVGEFDSMPVSKLQ